MSELTPNQRALVEQYEDYTLEELYNLVGNLAAEYGNEAIQGTYVVGLPNVFERGEAIVERARAAICEARQRLEEALADKHDALDLFEWAGTLADVLLAANITGGIPPFSIVVALGKISRRSLAKLCAGDPSRT